MRQKKQSYEIEKIKPTSIKRLSKVIGRGLLWIPKHLLIFMILIFIVLLIFRIFWASKMGKFAGAAMGSFEGVTTGIKEGAEEGKKAGLSAKDVAVRVGDKIKAEEKLQVLLVDLDLSDIYQQGKNYAVLYSKEGEGVFTVDLSGVKVDNVEGKIVISIPVPEFELYPNDSKVEILDEYQAPLFNGTTKDGYTGYLNSSKEYIPKVEEMIIKDDVLMEQAKASALQQVEALAKAVCGNETVEVRFLEDESSY